MQFDINNVIMQEFGIARGNMNVQDVSGNKCDNVSPHLPVASFTTTVMLFSVLIAG
jgi:hypothetical protein